MEKLPMELVTGEVLPRLPIKSLVRCRCVCKSWYSLISSPSFISSHLARFHNDDPAFLMATMDGCRSYKWTLLSTNTYNKITSNDYTILDNQHMVDWSADCCPRAWSCSVNGLVLVSKRLRDPSDGRFLGRQLMLWNPMIGKTHEISTHELNNHFELDMWTHFGFGFSQSRNDCKVLAITFEPETSVHVYSLSTRTWRTIFEYDHDIISNTMSDGFSLVQGEIHFVSESFMVLFDVEDEVFRYVALPRLGLGFCNFPVVYRGVVALLDLGSREDCAILWVMEEEDGIPGSWRKMYTVELELPCDDPWMVCLFKENGEFMLRAGDVKVYNVESGEVKHIRENYDDFIEHSSHYKGSLMLL